VKLVHDWPMAAHPCGPDAIAWVRFKGPCRDGAEASCLRCGQVFQYVKPQPRRDDPQPQGKRDYF